MTISKYPIIKNGIKYMIYIQPHYNLKYLWDVELYIDKPFKLFKNKTYKKRVLIKYFGHKGHLYTFEDVEYLDKLDFIEMTTKTIDEYESKILNKKIVKSELDIAQENFNNWNGEA